MASIDLRSLGKKVRRSAWARRIKGRSREVGSLAGRLVRALLPPPGPKFVERAWAPSAPSNGSGEPHHDGDSGLPGHLGHLMHKRLRQLAECRDFASAKDPEEALHDTRVASRRLRAFIAVFEPLLDPPIVNHVAKPLRKVTRTAGALRDRDVQMALLSARLESHTDDATRAALEHVQERVSLERAEAERVARKRLQKVDFDDVSVGMCAALGETVARLPPSGAPTSQLVWDLLAPFVARVEVAEPPSDGTERPEEMHRLRISIKKLRYAMELLAPVLGQRHGELSERAESLQELLGRHHDLVVLGDLVEQQRRELEQRGRRTLSSGLSILKDDLAAEQHALYTQLEGIRPDAGWWGRSIRAALEKP